MTRKLLIFAQLAEAEATLKRLRAQVVPGISTFVWSEGNVSSLYTYENGLIALSGMGIAAALATTARYLSEVDEVINLGLSGALREDLSIGSLTTVELVGKHTPLPDNLDAISFQCAQRLHSPLPLTSRGLRLVTSDFPIHDHTLKKALSKKWDMVDMEGYGVAYAASAADKKCTLVKIVSDFASPKGRSLIRTHKKELSAQLACYLNQTLLS